MFRTSALPVIKRLAVRHLNTATSQIRGLLTTPTVNRNSTTSYYVRSYSTSIKKISVSNDGNNLQVDWTNEKKSNFHSMWLRFNCQCSECMEHQSNMTRYAVDKIPMEMKLTNAERTANGNIRVKWDAENHSAEFDPSYLERNCYSDVSLHERRKETKPVWNTEKSLPEISFSDVNNSDQGMYSWLRTINEGGLCLLTGVPTEHNYIKKVIKLIGPLQNTLYGSVYDVRLEANPINVAYTNESLAFHMDLMQYESPPGIQMLHCLEFESSIEGGETTFIDMFAVAETFRQKYPEHFKTLSSVPATFIRIHMTRDHPVKMVIRKPHIVLNHQNEIIGINWHANLQGPLSVEEKFVEDYYKAYQLFGREVCDGIYTKEIRLSPGDLVAYNNRRMAHGRNAFNKNGKRHLQGGYINIDDYKSKLMALAESVGNDEPVKRVFNNDWF